MTAPLQIGLLTPTFVGVTGFDSGIGAHFRHLADGLAAAGHTVRVVAVTDKPVAATPANFPYDVRLVQVPRPALARLVGKFSWQLHQWTNVRAAIAAADTAAAATTVDIWESTSTGALALHLLARRARPPVAVRVSTTASQLRATNAGAINWISRQIEAWEREVIGRADCVVTHSASHRAAIAEQFQLRAGKIPIVPHGIPVPPALPRATEPSRCAVLYVGRFEHRKGIDLLLAALPAVLAAVPRATVTLVGADANGYWQNRWRQETPALLRERVTFAGVVDAVELAQHYRAADIFVAPSRYESFGLIFVEAMAHGVPVVALRAPGAVDIIESGKTGLLAEPENPAALAEALVALARDPARRTQMGAAARQVVEKFYSVPILAANSERLYRDVIAARRPPPT